MDRSVIEITDSSTITGLLIEAKESSHSVVIWQKHEDKRKLAITSIFGIKDGEIYLHAKDIPDLVKLFKPEMLLSFNITGYYFAFHGKLQISKQSAKILILPIPRLLRFQNIRKNPEPFYQDAEYNLMTFKYFNRGTKIYASANAVILNLTPHKITFIIKESDEFAMRPDTEIEITRLPAQPHLFSAKAKVMHNIIFDPAASLSRVSYITALFTPPIPDFIHRTLHIKKADKD